MSLNDLIRHSKKMSMIKAVAASTLVAGAIGFTVMKRVDSQGNVIENNSVSSAANSGISNPGSSSTGVAGFAASNPAIPSSATTGNSGSTYSSSTSPNFNPEACIKNPSVETCLKDSGISQSDWDKLLPPEGIVAYDNHGNVIFKKCRSLTEGASAAQTEMNTEKARFDKFNTAMSVNAGNSNYNRNDDNSVNCSVGSSKAAPKQQPCPTMQNYTELKNYYREQYYQMSNQLQSRAASTYGCGPVRDIVMAAVDPNWKSDRGIASQGTATSAPVSSRGEH